MSQYTPGEGQAAPRDYFSITPPQLQKLGLSGSSKPQRQNPRKEAFLKRTFLVNLPPWFPSTKAHQAGIVPGWDILIGSVHTQSLGKLWGPEVPGARHVQAALTQSVQTLGPWNTTQPGPSGTPWVSESPGSKGADKPSGNSPLTGSVWTQGHGAPAGPAWAQGFLRMLEESSQSDSRSPRWAGLPPHTHRQDPSPARPRVAQRQAKGSAPNSGQPRARPRRPRAPAPARPRHQNIPAARFRPSRGAPSPPLLAVSSLRAPRAPSVRPGPGLEIPVTDLAFHLGNRDPSDSRGSVGSAGFVRTQSPRPGACHSLSPAASLANEHGGWRYDGQFLASGAGLRVRSGFWTVRRPIARAMWGGAEVRETPFVPFAAP